MDKLVRAYRDVFGSAGPGSERTDEEISDILISVHSVEGARVIARKELSGQFVPEEAVEAREGASRFARSSRSRNARDEADKSRDDENRDDKDARGRQPEVGRSSGPGR